MPVISRALALVLALGLAQAGCGTTDDGSLPYHPFDPGAEHPGGAGSGSGSSGSGGGTITPPQPPPGPPECADSLKRCPHTFVWPARGDERSVTLLGDFDGWSSSGAPMTQTVTGGSYTVTVPVVYSGQVIYKFHVVTGDGSSATDQYLPDPNNPTQVDDGFGGKNSVLVTSACDDYSCASTQIACPGGAPAGAGTWDWRDAVMYFVLVDRFLDGDPSNDRPVSASGLQAPANWQGGDWAGVRQKIAAGYFAQLGVNTLWLSVPLDSTDASGVGDDGMLYTGYHGYWPRDLAKPESRLGTADELRALVAEAHQAGLKVLIDYAMNHVHVDSPVWLAHQSDGWFNPLQQAGQACVCGTGACQYDGPYAKTCWFRDYLPDFNFANAEARAYSVQNALDWITGYGFDGFRLDAVKHIESAWLSDLRARLTQEVEPASKQHVYLVGETFTGDQAAIKSFVDPCQLLDGQFDFPLRAQVNAAVLARQGTMLDLAAFLDANTSYYGAGVMSTFLGNHDVPRAIHFAEDTPRWSDVWATGKDHAWSGQPEAVSGSSAYERLALGLALLWTNRGVPLLYYGDEIGLAGAGDPDNRRFMPWSGYTAGQQLLLGKVQKLGAIRAAHPALRRGDRTTLSVDADTWAYRMTDGSDTLYVALNRADQARAVAGLPSGALTDLGSGETVTGPSVSVPARGYRILQP